MKELFREGISGHTCDRRGTKSYIEEAFPAYKIEAGFSETDLLWKPLVGEVPVDEDIRSKEALDEVFNSDDSTYVSITSHSGEISSLLRGMFRNFFCFDIWDLQMLTTMQFSDTDLSLSALDLLFPYLSRRRQSRAKSQRQLRCHGLPYPLAALSHLFQHPPNQIRMK